MNEQKNVIYLSQESVSNFKHLLSIELPKLKKSNANFYDMAIELSTFFEGPYEGYIKIYLDKVSSKNTFLISFTLYNCDEEKDVASDFISTNDLFTTLSLQFENDDNEELSFKIVIKDIDKQ